MEDEIKAGVTEKAAGSASGGVPGGDGGKGRGGRCTTQIDRGRDIFFHWTNYLWERIRGVSQHQLPPSARQWTAEHSLSAKGKEKIIYINTAQHSPSRCSSDGGLFFYHSFRGGFTLWDAVNVCFAMRGNSQSIQPLSFKLLRDRKKKTFEGNVLECQTKPFMKKDHKFDFEADGTDHVF